MRRFSPFVISLSAILIAGCKDKQELVPAPVVHTPLALDPMDNVTLPAWWRSDRVMLHLAGDGEYRIYDGANRYRRPIETGRWSQSSYAVVNLKPYRRLHGEPFEARIDRVAGRITLTIPDMSPMVSIERPPRVTEDLLIGAWFADIETIVIHPDLSFEYRTANQPIGARPMRGDWRVDSDQLILSPQTSAAGRYVFRVVRDDSENISLRNAEKQFQRLTNSDAQSDA